MRKRRKRKRRTMKKKRRSLCYRCSKIPVIYAYLRE